MATQLMETSVQGSMRGAGLAATAASAIERVTLRKAFFRLIPFLMVCYVIASLNRVNLSFAALQMNKDLGLTAAAYGFGVGIFFITYSLCEIPSNLLLHRFGASRWIARIMLTWGVCAIAMAFVRGSLSLYVVRLLLGAAEAGFYPGVLYFITLWFPKAHRGRINGLFLASIPISGIIGNPVSGWLLTLNGLLGDPAGARGDLDDPQRAGGGALAQAGGARLAGRYAGGGKAPDRTSRGARDAGRAWQSLGAAARRDLLQ
jgi:MFS family permease